MVGIQIRFYASTSQTPILNEIGLILNSKIREWMNIRSTINRYLPTVEHQLTWKKEKTVVQWSVVNNFSLVIINLHPQGKGQQSCIFSTRIIIRQHFPQLLLSNNSEKKPPFLNFDVVIEKNLFLSSVLIWWKTRKRKPRTHNFIEKAWICRTGPIFQRFSVIRRQARSERERRSPKKKTKKTPATLCTPR